MSSLLHHHLRNPYGADVLAVAGGSVPGAEESGYDAAEALRTYPSADRVAGRGRCAYKEKGLVWSVFCS